MLSDIPHHQETNAKYYSNEKRNKPYLRSLQKPLPSTLTFIIILRRKYININITLLILITY